MPNSELALVQTILYKLYPHYQSSSIRKLEKGLSNRNFYFELDGNKYIIKFYADSVPHEALQAQQQLAELGLTQSVLHVDAQEKIAVLEYLTAASHDVEVSEALVKALVAIHDCNVLDKTKLELKHHLCEAAFFLNLDGVADKLNRQFSQWPHDIRYCHNDLVKDNVLQTSKGIYFIDFEYAQYNDLYFDLAALSCSFELTRSQQKTLLDTYYDNCESPLPNYAEKKLEAYIGCYLIVSIAWYQKKQFNEPCKPLEYLLIKWLEENR
ncbi:phosphotransferase [Pseudoalteromonas luteoviolacea]|uniref:Aminoglycoside phosphotransferase domain-containing protein n=1 Tax=Pseudoalteromonas luteoviolacea S4060-1 TaxID=1365257 RepID=A0A167NYK3_9GAMM|nr:phosphotransferase [Pseudoalteromonas luteoviolacea]KZN69101.1 hypothetical protein N478_13035 [Pseudoalteromonas luteoviolacea S4060-1]